MQRSHDTSSPLIHKIDSPPGCTAPRQHQVHQVAVFVVQHKAYTPQITLAVDPYQVLNPITFVFDRPL